MTTSEFGRTPASGSEEPRPPIATPSDIYKELQRIAYINPDFRQHKTGTFNISVEQGEPVNLVDYKTGDIEDWEVGDPWPQPRLIESYILSGRRAEIEGGKKILSFEYIYTNGIRGIRLPRHIAAYAFRGITQDGEPVDPVEAAGPTTLEHTLEFSINSADLDLTATESFAYYDHQGDRIARAASLLDPHEEDGMTVTPPTDLLDGDEDDDTGPIIDHDRPGPIDFDSLVDPRAPTSFYNDAADHLERVMGAPTLDDLREISNDFDVETRELLVAYHVLQSMKKTFRRQLGMQL